MSTAKEDAAEVFVAPEATGAATGRKRLVGRRILMMGAGQRPTQDEQAPIGNGRAISVLLAREGAAVACVDRDEASLATTVGQISKEGGKAIPLIGDGADEKSVRDIVDRAMASLGGLDGFVANVGIDGGKNLEGTTVEMWDRLFVVNTRAHFLTCKYVLPHIERGGSGVLISALAAFTPGSRMPAYDASKGALSALARHAALEGRRKQVRVNLVVPGLIDTPMGRAATAERPARASVRIPLGRQGTGWDVAYGTAFLLSHEASYITGHHLVIDGGMSTIR